MSSFWQFGRIWLLGLVALTLSLAGCGFTVAPPGFVREHRHAVCRSSFDWNSHRRFSLTFDTYDHLPPDSARVKLFRWSHGGSVDQPREIAFDESAPSPQDASALEPPAPPGTEQMPAEGAMAEPKAPGNVEFLPPPPAPPSESEDSGFPPVDDASGNTDQDSLSSESQGTPTKPLVSISFTEDLTDPIDEGTLTDPGCKMPNGDMVQE